MSMYDTWWYAGMTKIAKAIAKANWTHLRGIFRQTGRGYDLTEADHEKIKELLAGGYYLILNYRKSHLSTYVIGALSFVTTKQWPEYMHVLMNLDLVDNPAQAEDFKLMEATNTGVHYSSFMEVFDCDSVCILQPRNMDKTEWELVMKGLAEQLGKPYDNLFNIKDDARVSCVEMVLDSLRESPNYAKDFPNLEAMIKKVGNLTPQMYRDCPDFEVIFEVKR